MPTRTSAKSEKTAPHHVAALAYEGLCTLEFGIAAGIFGFPRPELPAWYSFSVCGLEKRPLRATGGLCVLPNKGLDGLKLAQTIVIPGWCGPYDPVPPKLIRALLKAYRRGARLVSICTGAFVLAAAGLLNGRRATTNWRYVDSFSGMFPLVELERDVLYVDDGRVMTSAGCAAGIDLCLHIIRKDHGARTANLVARDLVVGPHREGNQTQIVSTPVDRSSSPWMSRLLAWVQSRLDSDININQLARQAHMSKRTLSRRFIQTTGMPPLAWLTGLRVRHARDLLETTRLPIEDVARRCGFGSAPRLRYHFRSALHLSPTLYRQRLHSGQVGVLPRPA